MKLPSALLLALALAACGGNSAPAWVQPQQPTPQTSEMLVVQPLTVPVYDDRSPPRGTIGITRWRMTPQPGDVWSADGIAGISIDSAFSTQPVLNKGTIILSVNLATPVPALNLVHSFDLRVPFASTTGAGVAHAVAYYSLEDMATGEHFYHGLIVYDTRCGRSGDVAKLDEETRRMIHNIVAPAYRCRPFNDWQSFVFVPQMKLSATTRLRGIALNPETHTAQGEHARIDVEVRNWRLGR